MTRKEFEMNLILLGGVKRQSSDGWVSYYGLNGSDICVHGAGVKLQLRQPWEEYTNTLLMYETALAFINDHLDKQERTNGKET